jgi:MOSC domain-containing protein YiiM
LNPARPADQRQRRPTAFRCHRTAHDHDRDLKSPAEAAVAVRGANLDGDAQADGKLRGGPDKAVYACAS